MAAGSIKSSGSASFIGTNKGKKKHRGQTVAEGAPVVVVGDRDPMSFAARYSGLPLCEKPDTNWRINGRPLRCTRALGHAEGNAPASDHVSVGRDHRAKAVWS